MIHFPFETNGKLMVLGVPILKHFRVKYVDVITLIKFRFYSDEKK